MSEAVIGNKLTIVNVVSEKMYSIFLFFSYSSPIQLLRLTKGKLEYLVTLAYQGFYCFEAITTRNLDDFICGICGIIGEVNLGDGNEKNCCVNNRVSLGFLLL